MVKPGHFMMFVLLPILLLNGCSKKPGEQLLVSKTWILSSYGLRDNEKHRLTEGVHYYLNLYAPFDNATLSTSCPAQDLSGKYRINDQGRIFISDCYAHTMQRCPDDDGSENYQQGHKFIDAVIFRSQTGSKYHIQGNELTLTSSDGKQLFFTGVTNGQRWNFFEQLLGGLLLTLAPCVR